jgi:hypothetical protein
MNAVTPIWWPTLPTAACIACSANSAMDLLIVADWDGASFARVVPGSELPLPFIHCAVTFSAGRANYRLTSHLRTHSDNATGSMQLRSVETDEAQLTITVSSLVFNHEQYELLVALAANRAAGPLESDRRRRRLNEWSVVIARLAITHRAISHSIGLPL